MTAPQSLIGDRRAVPTRGLLRIPGDIDERDALDILALRQAQT